MPRMIIMGKDEDNAEDGGEDDDFGFGCGFSACKWFHSSHHHSDDDAGSVYI